MDSKFSTLYHRMPPMWHLNMEVCTKFPSLIEKFFNFPIVAVILNWKSWKLFRTHSELASLWRDHTRRLKQLTVLSFFKDFFLTSVTSWGIERQKVGGAKTLLLSSYVVITRPDQRQTQGFNIFLAVFCLWWFWFSSCGDLGSMGNYLFHGLVSAFHSWHNAKYKCKATEYFV